MKKDWDKTECGKKEKPTYCGVCADGSFEDAGNIDAGVTQYMVKPLLADNTTGCITQGYVKYVKNNKTVALVEYGKDGNTT